MNVFNINIIKITFSLILGILLAHFNDIQLSILIFIEINLIIGLTILHYKQIETIFFEILLLSCFVGIGVISFKLSNEKLSLSHYSNQTLYDEHVDVIFKINNRLKPNLNYNRYEASIQSINQKSVRGTVLVNIERDTLNTILNVDDIVYTKANFQKVKPPLNPYQFNYKAYLERNNIYNQLYLKSDELLLSASNTSSVYGYADRFRALVNTKLIESGFSEESRSIINALLLGQRQDIDSTIYNNYINSGTIHILAVSGLHVGILLWILNALFKPLLFIKYGNYIKPILLVICLWTFAIIAGLSPSVTRAVTMFSIISIAMHLKRPTNIYNTLAISAFVLLLFNPKFLFDVGFQLSYLAVLGIVCIQPLIYKLWQPKNYIINKVWQVFTVTLAAQIGVVPISLFYFHQFPGLFFVSNIVVIPFIGFLLSGGLLVIALALLNILPDFIVETYSFIITCLNDFIAWIAQFENFLLKDIPFTFVQVIICYGFIFSLIQWYKTKRFGWLSYALIGVICFQLSFIYVFKENNTEEFVVFNKSRYTILAERNNNIITAYHKLDSLDKNSFNSMRDYKVGTFASKIEHKKLKSVYNFKQSNVLVIDSLAVYRNISFKVDKILLTDSPKLNLNRLIDSLNPKQIIADASNYTSYINRWKQTCIQKNIPFHYTNEKGAYILN